MPAGYVDVMEPISIEFIAATGVVLATVQAFKVAFPTVPDSRYPIVALAVSLLLHAAFLIFGGEVTNVIIETLLAAFTASGVFSQVKAVRERPYRRDYGDVVG